MIINIAICDDEKMQIKLLTDFVRNWADDLNYNVKISDFESAESFLFHYEDDKKFDIILLDIEMGELNGVDLAKRIRLSNEHVQILFITGFPDFIAEGYEVSALHYLIKPVKPDKLCDVLNKAVTKLNKAEDAIVINSTRVKLSDILYVESIGHYIEINTVNEKFKIKKKLSQIPLDDSFVVCHRSYTVGLRHIHKITKTDVILDNKKLIPLSRRVYGDVNSAFINFYKGE